MFNDRNKVDDKKGEGQVKDFFVLIQVLSANTSPFSRITL